MDRYLQFSFLAAVILTAFAIGLGLGTFETYPAAILFNAYKTAKTQIEWLTGKEAIFEHIRFVNVDPDYVEANRFEFLTARALADPILVAGGFGQFAEYCPGHTGCLAVEYAGAGEVIHAYPYRPKEIEKTSPSVAFPYEQPLGFSVRDGMEPWSVLPYANGDLLVTFHSRMSFPYGQGVARINRDGWPIWYRRDYSHHEPHITEEGNALVPSQRIGRKPHHFSYRKRPFRCAKTVLDTVHIIDYKGQLVNEVSVIDSLLESPHAPVLRYTMDPCDPTHLNSVHELNRTARGDFEPGDLLISLRNLAAFVILDGDTYRLKRLVRGGFFAQHSVKHLEGSKILIFDNWGRGDAQYPSRLLLVDIANGAEKNIFPNDRTPEHLRSLSSFWMGGISISPDRRRVFITFTESRKAVEVRISDGAALTVFHSLHNIKHLDSGSEERKSQASIFPLHPIRYIEIKGQRRQGSRRK